MKSIKGVIIAAALTVLLIGCSDSSDKAPASEIKANSSDIHASSQDSMISITPADATVQSIITLRIKSTIKNTGNIHWYINDMRNEKVNGTRFSSGKLAKGDIVHAVILDSGKEYRSNTITIRNTPPAITESDLLPSIPKTGSTLTVNAKAQDADRDQVSFKYKWHLNGTYAGDYSFLDTDLKRGDTVSVEVTPYDNEEPGRMVRLKSMIFNSLPEFKGKEPLFDGTTYTYDLEATDPDGDKLTYALKKSPERMKLDPSTGTLTWAVLPADYGLHEISVSISDNNGGKILVPITARIQGPQSS